MYANKDVVFENTVFRNFIYLYLNMNIYLVSVVYL